MENNDYNVNQKQFEFKLMREGVVSEHKKKVRKLRDEMDAKVRELENERDRQLMDIQKMDDEWRGSRRAASAQGDIPVVSEHTDKNGKKWVRVRAGKYDFLIDLHDLTVGEVNWDKAMSVAKDAGVELPTREMWSLVGAFLPEINETLEKLGGDILKDWYWGASECYSNYAWVFNAYRGILYNFYKMYAYSCRGSLAFNSLNS